MKKIYIIIVIALGTIGCKKGVLDKLPLDNITEIQVWNDPNLIDAYLTQAYTQTTVWESELTSQPYMSSGNHFFPFIIHSVSDESRFNRTWAGNANAFKSAGIKINGGLLEWWETPYAIIRNLNDFIAKVPASNIDPALKKKRIAEARFIRAYNYFAMVVRYGGVPLILKVQNKNDAQAELYPKRNTEQELYDFVINEMDSVAIELPEKIADADYGRPSKYTAMALKSRAALYAGSIAQFGTIQLDGLLGIPASKANDYYTKSLNASTAIVQSGLYDLYNKYPSDKVKNFRNIFLDERNIETIFARQHDDKERESGGNGWQYDFFQCPVPSGWGGGNQNGVYLEMVEEFEYEDGRPGKLNWANLEQGLWATEDLWANRDPRFYATIYTQNTPWQGTKLDFHNGIVKPDGTITTTSYNGVLPAGQNKYTGFGVLKYLDESKDNLNAAAAYSSKQDWIIFRYSEILLNLAEANFELGNTADALEAINKIRRRAGVAVISAVTRDAIRHERKVELAFEGHRYWDLRRWRIAKQVLTVNRSGLRYILDYNTRKYKLQVLKKMDGANADPVFYDYNYYFPITLSRTASNNNLKENPGYQ